MNFLPTYRTTRKSAFTLVEMLTAIAVLSIMMALLGEILAMASRAWMEGQSNVNNFTKARAMLDTFATDIQSGLFRSDLCAFPADASGNTLTEFYTKRQGIVPAGGNGRDISLVQYLYGSDTTTTSGLTTLQRGDLYFDWTGSAGAIPFGNTTNFGNNAPTARDMAPGVVDYKVLFVYADGTVSRLYTVSSTNPLRAVGLTLAVVDDRTLKQLSAQQVQSLRSSLDGDVTDSAVTSNRSVKALWESYENSALNWSAYPKNLGEGLKIFELYVTVTGF